MAATDGAHDYVVHRCPAPARGGRDDRQGPCKTEQTWKTSCGFLLPLCWMRTTKVKRNCRANAGGRGCLGSDRGCALTPQRVRRSFARVPSRWRRQTPKPTPRCRPLRSRLHQGGIAGWDPAKTRPAAAAGAPSTRFPPGATLPQRPRPSQQRRARLDYLAVLKPFKLSGAVAWNKRRLDHMLVDHVLRSGYIETAKAAAPLLPERQPRPWRPTPRGARGGGRGGGAAGGRQRERGARG